MPLDAREVIADVQPVPQAQAAGGLGLAVNHRCGSRQVTPATATSAPQAPPSSGRSAGVTPMYRSDGRVPRQSRTACVCFSPSQTRAADDALAADRSLASGSPPTSPSRSRRSSTRRQRDRCKEQNIPPDREMEAEESAVKLVLLLIFYIIYGSSG